MWKKTQQKRSINHIIPILFAFLTVLMAIISDYIGHTKYGPKSPKTFFEIIHEWDKYLVVFVFVYFMFLLYNVITKKSFFEEAGKQTLICTDCDYSFSDDIKTCPKCGSKQSVHNIEEVEWVAEEKVKPKYRRD